MGRPRRAGRSDSPALGRAWRDQRPLTVGGETQHVTGSVYFDSDSLLIYGSGGAATRLSNTVTSNQIVTIPDATGVMGLLDAAPNVNGNAVLTKDDGTMTF